MLDKSSVIDAGKLGLKMWLFDLQAAAAGKASPKDNQDSVLYSAMYGTEEEAGNFGSPVFYTLSDKEAKVEAPKPADPTPSTPSAPATFDAGIVAAVAAVVSGAAVVFSKKRR